MTLQRLQFVRRDAVGVNLNGVEGGEHQQHHHDDVGEEDDRRYQAVVLVNDRPQVHPSGRRSGHSYESAPNAVVDSSLRAEANVNSHSKTKETHRQQGGVLDQSNEAPLKDPHERQKRPGECEVLHHAQPCDQAEQSLQTHHQFHGRNHEANRVEHLRIADGFGRKIG
eukprot:Skav231056  [mRNA]  locus=scaffold2842:90730:94392:- [translate_table: standard]